MNKRIQIALQYYTHFECKIVNSWQNTKIITHTWKLHTTTLRYRSAFIHKMNYYRGKRKTMCGISLICRFFLHRVWLSIMLITLAWPFVRRNLRLRCIRLTILASLGMFLERISWKCLSGSLHLITT